MSTLSNIQINNLNITEVNEILDSKKYISVTKKELILKRKVFLEKKNFNLKKDTFPELVNSTIKLNNNNAWNNPSKKIYTNNVVNKPEDNTQNLKTKTYETKINKQQYTVVNNDSFEEQEYYEDDY